MKRISALIILVLFSFSGFAQNPNKSTLHFRLSNGQPLTITINGRDFRKVNTQITLVDLPGKRHSVQVYRFRPYADGKGGKAELVYSGSFKIQKGNVYDVIVDVNQRILRIKNLGRVGEVDLNRNNSAALPPSLPPNAQNNVIPEQEYIPENSDMNISARLLIIKEQMDIVDEDSKKLKIAQDYIQKNPISTADLRNISSWIMFDDNKMILLKSAYSKIKDKQNFAGLKTIFILPETQSDFEKYANGLR
ncbi:MAG TPA: DUF4476 domain-containing protein [Edaphocola sp.]|nr:DUF4476 domain-containing protein [Edaphocola sp.]